MLAKKMWRIMKGDIEVGRESHFDPAYKLAIKLIGECPKCEIIVLGEDKLIILNNPTE